MSKASALPLDQKNTACQAFKTWVLEKGVEYVKRGNLKAHLVSFEEETEAKITYFLAHVLLARLVRRHRRTTAKNRRH